MNKLLQRSNEIRHWIVLGLVVAVLTILIVNYNLQFSTTHRQSGRLITIYDRGIKSSFITDAKTVNDALISEGIVLDQRDTVEPSRNEELVAPEYKINIYRARPVVVVDGQVRVKIISPYQTPDSIVKAAGINIFSEDEATIKRINNFTSDGAGLELNIKRATKIILNLYGKTSEVRTQADTVEAMLREKNIELGKNGRVSLPMSTPITTGLEIRVWREGKQTITAEQVVSFESEQIFDADRPIGYRQIQTAGETGTRQLTYEIEITEGVEVSRKLIASIDTKAPKKEIVLVGIKPGPNSLTKSKGAQFWTDSKGIVHRETYYDLDMGRVMQACGQGGKYSVRADGVKIDSDGYVIIAANLQRYPRCSVVETSVGLAKVYDTGGFAEHHPEGYDLATDWSNYNGR